MERKPRRDAVKIRGCKETIQNVEASLYFSFTGVIQKWIQKAVYEYIFV